MVSDKGEIADNTTRPVFASTNRTRVDNQLQEFLNKHQSNGALEVRKFISTGHAKYAKIEFYYHITQVDNFEE